MQVNDKITLDVTDLSFDAMGIGKVDGQKVFVNNALPGEKVEAKIIKVCHSYAVGQTEKLLTKSPDRNNGENDKWAKDGFANLANMKYEQQLIFKKQRIEETLSKAGLEKIKVADVVPSPKQVGYRNQRLVYVRNYDGKLEFGFLQPFTNQFTPLNNFLTTNKEVAAALAKMKEVLRKLKMPAYDPATNTGFIRNVDVRRSESTGKIMVILVVNEKDRPNLPDLIGQTYAKLPQLYGFSMNYNPHRTAQIWGKRDIPLWGENYLTDKIAGMTFRFSPQSYFQFNSVMAPKVRKLAIKAADLKPDDVIIDAYSGVGTIGLLAAKSVKAVRGIEKIKAAVADAKANAETNKISNAKFYKGDVDKIMARWQKQGFKANAVFVDPPLKGLSKGLINSLAKMGVERIVYVSANPATLVRDLKRFAAYSYECKQITPLDVAPQKSDVKCIAALKLSK